MLSLPSTRRTGNDRVRPPSTIMLTRGVAAYSYQVTTLVHSPASVGAISSPTSALSSVDLPAFIFPAMATRSGSSTRSRCCLRTATAWG